MAQAAFAVPVAVGATNPAQWIASDRDAYAERRKGEVEKLVAKILKDPTVIIGIAGITQNDQAIPDATKEAIKNVLQCPANSHAQILGISEGAAPADVTAAWRRLGCLVQPYMKDKTAGDAFCSNFYLPQGRITC